MKEKCLQQINNVQMTLEKNMQPYTYRSRIGRLILTCTRMIAKELGCVQPHLPGIYRLQSGTPLQMQNIINCCNRLLELSVLVSQPSEPLEERWHTQWAELIRELNLLREYVAAA